LLLRPNSASQIKAFSSYQFRNTAARSEQKVRPVVRGNLRANTPTQLTLTRETPLNNHAFTTGISRLYNQQNSTLSHFTQAKVNLNQQKDKAIQQTNTFAATAKLHLLRFDEEQHQLTKQLFVSTV